VSMAEHGPPAVRVLEAERITRPGEEIVRVRVVEYAPAAPTEDVAALPRGYDPVRDSPLADSGLRYVPAAPPGAAALPPAPRQSRWWLW
jgi:hypothetical protein